jgi:putative ubiquitin-RnfH superfamily antitoxin RatB of RatAB toxin-antitoxin module
MAEPARKRCTVVFATPERQFEWGIELEPDATIATALERARMQAGTLEIPWETCDVGIFGEPCDRGAVPREGDRIEIYRPLGCDPREARRDRVRRARANRSGR